MKTLTLLLTLLFTFNASANLIVYTDRKTDLMMPIAENFEKATGTKVEIIEKSYADIKAALAANSPADVIFVKDLIYLNELTKANRFQAMPGSVASKVDASMRDANNKWAAITFRVRTLVYEAGLDVSAIKTYADLSKPEYAQTLCLRTSQSSYNEALVASLITNNGYDAAKNIVNGWLDNRTEDMVYKDDTAIIKAIATGTMSADGANKACSLGITNSYYLGLYLQQEPNAPVKIKFLNQGTTGVHSNGMGAGISASSKQADLAGQFIDFLLSKETQIYLTNKQQDFPANKSVKAENMSFSWGQFKTDSKNWSAVGENIEKAKKLMGELDYQ